MDRRVLTLVDEIGNLHYIARLEEAYISSRYLPIEYERREAEDLLRFVKEVFKPIVEAV
ncbi:HEPN domain protein [compost metagenome]